MNLKEFEINFDDGLKPYPSGAIESRSTCFHGRHISPQIFAGITGCNWRIEDYLTRNGYDSIKKLYTLKCLLMM